MLLSKSVVVNIGNSNKKYYQELGYDVSNSSIEVSIKDLPKNSRVLVKIQCDYCGKIFERKWNVYNESKHQDFDKDSCNECSKKKSIEVKKQRYGSLSPKEISLQINGEWKSPQEIPYDQIKLDYEKYGCILLLTEDEYIHGNGTKTIAPYICSCGKRQDGRTIYYFRHKNHLCESCSKEKVKKDNATKLGNDFKSVQQKMLSDNKELLTQKEYFVKTDDIEYKCLLCGTINKVKYYTFKDPNYSCKGCREIENRMKQWEKALSIAAEYGLTIITTFEEFCDDNSRITIRCSCGELFNTMLSEYLYDSKRQCNTCGLKLRSGENSYKWKGGITPELEKIRGSKEYMHWRDEVYERDNYTCQCCGDHKGGNLNAHHILNFSDHIDIRFNVENGITLCDACHNPNKIGSFHHIYGTHDNTKTQLQEYFDNKRKDLGLYQVDIDTITSKNIHND